MPMESIGMFGMGLDENGLLKSENSFAHPRPSCQSPARRRSLRGFVPARVARGDARPSDPDPGWLDGDDLGVRAALP